MAGYEPTSGRTVALCCVVCESTFDHATKRRGRYPRFCSDRCRESANGRPSAVRRAPAGVRTLHDLACVQCGRGFKALDPKRKCCGRECGGQWSKARQTEWRARKAAERNTRVCQSCGVTFRRSRSSDPGKYCSRACVALGRRKYSSPDEARKAGKQRERDRRRAAKGLDQPVSCARCHLVFRRKHIGQMFCSTNCRLVPKRLPRCCSHCGSAFTPAHGGAALCSEECRGAKRRINLRNARPKGGRKDRDRARKAGVKYEPINRAKLYERDGWRCQVCGRKTPKALRGKLVDNAPELDHRVPLCLGGDHTWENVQTACRRCNAKKAGRHVVGQLALFARPRGGGGFF